MTPCASPRLPYTLTLALAFAVGACSSNPTPDGGSPDASDVLGADHPADIATGDASTDVPDAPPPGPVASHSSSIALSPDGTRLYVVNADADSLSVIDPAAHTLLREIPLGTTPPAVDPATTRYDPAVEPRSVAVSPDGTRLYVSGERSSDLMVVDPVAGTVLRRIPVGSEPAGVLASQDGASVYVACSQDATVVRVDLATGMVAGTALTAAKPWALAWSPDGTTLLVSHLVIATSDRTQVPGVTNINPSTMAVGAVWNLPSTAPRGTPFNRLLPYGEVRGVYDLAPRPGSTDVWTLHLELATSTPETTPDMTTLPTGQLDFQSTVFPAISVLGPTGVMSMRMTINVMATTPPALPVPPDNGQFEDIVSGPHALAFTPDGLYALVLNTNSEDLLVVNATTQVEDTLFTGLPGHMPEGIVLSADGTRAYVDERNTGDVAVITVTPATATSGPTLALASPGGTINRFMAGDPMPANLRSGQRVFYSANSDPTTGLPITQNHWVACASCHIEGRSDAVVWLFSEGPRDTPSNAGGTLHTGFLLHTADRNTVRDYAQTINVEQGGSTTWATDPTLSPLLDNLRDFVNLAIPYPVPPHTDPTLVAQGMEVFNRPAVGCASCHTGDYYTDSGAGNPTLDLEGVVLRHSVGTCNTGTFPDNAHPDFDGNARPACLFDTPTLRGVADTAPYLHDGSAITLMDVLTLTRGQMGDITSLSTAELNALVEYLRSL